MSKSIGLDKAIEHKKNKTDFKEQMIAIYFVSNR